MLQALLEYARQEQLTAQPGLKPKTVRWLLVFSVDGAYLGLQDLRGDDRKSKGRVFPGCPDLTQQEMVAAGAGCRHFLVDSLDVVCLFTKEEEVDNKLAAKHEFFVNLLCEAAAVVPVLGPIADRLRDDGQLSAIRDEMALRKARPTELVTFAVAQAGGPSILVETDHWQLWWQAFRQRMADTRKAKSAPTGRRKKEAAADGPLLMRCLASGELIEPLPTHNKIEGLTDVGGLAMGDALTSFDKDAFGSFGLEQGANAAMSEAAVKTYVTALNHLIRYRARRMAGVKVVYWYSGKVASSDDPLRELYEGFGFASPEDAGVGESETGQQPPGVETLQRTQSESCVHRLLRAIDAGERPEWVDCRYYALTLSANSGRVVVRDWMEGQFEDLVRAIDAWFDDLAIISRDGGRIIASHKFAAVLAAPLRDLKDAPASMSLALWRCAVKRQPIPYSIMAQTLQRVRNDVLTGQTALHARFGLLKAFCNRNERIATMNAELNDYTNDPAYLCGRILALLAGIQRRALGDVGAGVVQRYYAAASSTPALVLGRLVRTAQIGHLPKIGEKGLQLWYERQLADVWARFSERPKAVLSLEEQTLFAMGYYQQIAQRREDKSEASDNLLPDPAS